MGDYDDRFDGRRGGSGGGGAAGVFVFVALLLLVGGGAFVMYAFLGNGGSTGSGTGPVQPTRSASASGADSHSAADARPTPVTPEASAVAPRSSGRSVQINIAYGTEKKLWLNWAADEFAKTPAGKRIDVNLIGMGSVEGAHAVLNGPGETPIHVWSPASSAYRDVFETEWQFKHGTGSPIIKEEALALSPMIFVMWKDRYDAMNQKYPQIGFDSLGEAMHADGGWGDIAGKPDWGFFKFSHTHPNQSNSGLITLVLTAYDYHKKTRDLTKADITDPKFQAWLKRFERGVARQAGELSHSTGTLMRTMILRGPSTFDCLMVYENLAIEYLRAAAGRWGELYVTYPELNMWNENPYYVLDVPWSSKDQRSAAVEFLEFLMSEPIQAKAIEHGFRPGNPLVPIKGPASPFVRFAKHGIKIDVPKVCEPPKAAVLQELLGSFLRIDR